MFVHRAAGDRGFDPFRLASIKPAAVDDSSQGLPWYVRMHRQHGKRFYGFAQSKVVLTTRWRVLSSRLLEGELYNGRCGAQAHPPMSVDV